MFSVANEPLGTIALTNAWQNSPSHVRIDSHSQLHIFLDYNPAAGEIIIGTGTCEIQLLYSVQPGDFDQPSGGSGTFTWKGYCEELDQGDGSSLFQLRTWVIPVTAVENFDRDPALARPLAAKVAKIRAREVGITTHGTLIATLSAQQI